MGRWKRKESKKRNRNVATLIVEEAPESEFVFSPTNNSSAKMKNGNNVVYDPDGGSAALVVDDLMIHSSSTHSPDSLRIHRNFNIYEQERLYEYLLEYKSLSERQYCGKRNDDDGADVDTATPGSQNPMVNSSNEEELFHFTEYNRFDGLDVGGHIFPKLTLETVSSKPYLILPLTLNKKQRRCMHELCIEAGLFHETVGDHPHKRNLIVSSFLSGFDSFLKSGQLKSPNSIPVRGCKPWLYQSHYQISTLNAVQMYGSAGINYEEISKASPDSYISMAEQYVSWHFSRKRNRSTIGIEVDIVKSQWNTENDTNEIVTPKLNNTTFFQTRHILLENTESLNSCNVDDFSFNSDFFSDFNHVIPMAMKVAKEKIYELIDQPSQCIRYQHDELDFQKLRNHDLSTMVPLGVGQTSYLLVDTKETMLQCIHEIENSDTDVLAFDMEMYNPSAHTCITCLVQLATASKTYVIDVLVPEVWSLVSLLAPIFADSNVVKVGQAIGALDVPSLHRDFGIFVVNAFDTYEAARLLRLPKLGLSALCEYYGLPHDECKEYHRLKKAYQMTDWRKRPLSPSMLRYGRFDVHYLLALRKLMIRDLTRGDLWDDVGLKPVKSSMTAEAALISKTLKTLMQRSGNEYGEDADDTKSAATSQGSTEDGYFTPEEDASDDNQIKCPGDTVVKKLRMNANLMSVLSNSQQRCLSFWKNKKEHVKMRHGSFFTLLDDTAHSDITWSEHHSRLCEALVEWRQSIAKNEGTMPGLIFSTEFLMAIARKRPSSYDELRRLSFFLPELLQDEQSKYTKQLFNLIQSYQDVKGNFGALKSGTTQSQTVYEETNDKKAIPLIDQSQRSRANEEHRKLTSNDQNGVIKYFVTFAAFMVIGASATAMALRRCRR